jgi:hypothetical protein
LPRTLRQQQSAFAKNLGTLLVWIYAQGWEVTLADGFALTGHMAGSLHGLRLAQDLNLFLAGVWQQTICPEWQAIGAFWCGLDPDCAWGGNFATVDANHVSMKWGGKE